MKLRIGFDMDGILAQLLQQWVAELRLKPGVPPNLSVADITTWNITECPALTHLGKDAILDMVCQPHWFGTLKPIEGARVSLERLLRQGHQVEVITATPGRSSAHDDHVKDCKLQWLHKHLPCLQDTPVYFKQAHEKVQHYYDVLVEDHPVTMLTYAERHPRALVLGIKYPYNQHIPHVQPDTHRNPRDYEELANHNLSAHVCAPRTIRLADGWNNTRAAYHDLVREIEAEAIWREP